MLALLVDQFFAKPTTSTFSEIRLNESLLGATVVDRSRLGVRVGPPPDEPTTIDDLMARRIRVTDARDRSGIH
jgi:hypothetical protein